MKLTNAVELLAGVLERENVALANLDLVRAASFLAEKRAAVETLAGATFAGEATIEAMPRLRDLAAENRRLLERAMAVQGRVIEVIARAGTRTVATAGYRANGGLAAYGRQQPLALSARA